MIDRQRLARREREPAFILSARASVDVGNPHRDSSRCPIADRATRHHRHDSALRPAEYGQFRSNAFVRVLKNNGITGSMGRVGACGDNAAMESFFALLQKNVLDRQRWSTREELRLAIVVWIERTYHRKRRQRRLGKLTPIEFETINMALNAA